MNVSELGDHLPGAGRFISTVSPACNGDLVDVRLDIGGPLPATITPRALKDLALTEGAEVLAMVKSVSVSLGSGLNGCGPISVLH